MSGILLIVGVVIGIMISFAFPEPSQFVNDGIMNLVDGVFDKI